jgi:hypothetical protein
MVIGSNGPVGISAMDSVSKIIFIEREREIDIAKSKDALSGLPKSIDPLKRRIRASISRVIISAFCIQPCKHKMRSLLEWDNILC